MNIPKGYPIGVAETWGFPVNVSSRCDFSQKLVIEEDMKLSALIV